MTLLRSHLLAELIKGLTSLVAATTAGDNRHAIAVLCNQSL